MPTEAIPQLNCIEDGPALTEQELRTLLDRARTLYAHGKLGMELSPYMVWRLAQSAAERDALAAQVVALRKFTHHTNGLDIHGEKACYGQFRRDCGCSGCVCGLEAALSNPTPPAAAAHDAALSALSAPWTPRP